MREIKFRIWDKKSKKTRRLDSIAFDDEGNIKLINSWGKDIIEQKDIIVRRESDFVLMQYTGLKDKNGKEIYEGDMLQWEEGGKWYAGHWVVYNHAGFKLWNGRYHKTIIEPTWYEVIGNIYENKESLEENNE